METGIEDRDSTAHLLVGACRALASLGDSVGAVLASAPAPEVLAPALQRGHFRPTEEESLLDWFAHFLTVRNGLWEVVEEVSRPVGGRIEDLLDLALAGEGFDPVAVCGSPGCPPGLTVAPDAAAAIWASYR